MPELWEVKGAAKIRLFGPKDALDRVQTPAGVNQGRVAPDELLWLGDPELGLDRLRGQPDLASDDTCRADIRRLDAVRQRDIELAKRLAQRRARNLGGEGVAEHARGRSDDVGHSCTHTFVSSV